MNKPKQNFFCIRLQPAERRELDRLAKTTGRSRGGVIRRLILLASTEAGQEALGKVGRYDQQAN